MGNFRLKVAIICLSVLAFFVSLCLLLLFNLAAVLSTWLFVLALVSLLFPASAALAIAAGEVDSRMEQKGWGPDQATYLN